MNTNHVLIKIVLLVNVFFMSSFKANRAMNLSENNVSIEQKVDKSPVLGAWKFLMPEADLPYRNGRIFISETNDVYEVVISLKTGTLNGQDVEVENNRINFNINIEGIERTSFVLKVEGDKMVGEFYSNSSSSEVFAKRELPEE